MLFVKSFNNRNERINISIFQRCFNTSDKNENADIFHKDRFHFQLVDKIDGKYDVIRTIQFRFVHSLVYSRALGFYTMETRLKWIDLDNNDWTIIKGSSYVSLKYALGFIQSIVSKYEIDIANCKLPIKLNEKNLSDIVYKLISEWIDNKYTDYLDWNLKAEPSQVLIDEIEFWENNEN